MIAVGLVGAMLLGACSSSAGSSSASGASSGGAGSGGSSSAPQLSGSTYVIGNISSVSGTYATVAGGIPQLLDAWAQWTNAHGGVNGHPVKLISKDDGGIPATGIAAAKELVGPDHVMALVGLDSTTETAWMNVVKSAGVPVIGDNLGAVALSSEPLWFPTGSTSGGVSLGLLYDSAVNRGKKKFGVFYCSEFPACAQSVSLYQGVIASTPALAGSAIVYKAAVSISAPSYASQCVAAKQAGVQTIIVGVDAGTGLRIFNDCANQGYKPIAAVSGAAIDNTWLKDPVFEGTSIAEPDFAWFADSTAAEKAYESALKQYAPSLITSPSFNQNMSTIWSSLEVYKAAMLNAKSGANPTPSDVVAAMRSLPAKFDTNGLTPPLTYSKSGPNPGVNCYFNLAIKGGKFMIPGDGKYVCSGGS
jgi:branched-chain amino acid transport system substrate-binding protein